MADYTIVDAGGQSVRLSSPQKLYFPAAGITKLDLVEFYLDVAPAILAHLHDRPTVLKRFPGGADREPFFQKRIPETAPDWLQSAQITFPGGRQARELLPQDEAHLVWGVNLGVIDWNPWPVRFPDLDHPDELRVDLDPTPDASWEDVREVALCAGEVLAEFALSGYPKTSGSRGIHINVPIKPDHDFFAVRRAAIALAREVERRLPKQATTAWWKEERHGVFIDYNQNARDKTVASAYSVRPTPDARVSTPLRWDEVAGVDPAELTFFTVRERLRTIGDPSDTKGAEPGNLDRLLEQVQRDEEQGLGDAPWPPHYAKQPGEPKRVSPSRARKT